MKQAKYILISVITLILIGCSKPTQLDCFKFTYEGEEATICGFIPIPQVDSTLLTIPSTVTHKGQAYLVTKIGERAFENCDYIVSVTIPISIKEVGEGVFNGCKSLETINIPEDITYLPKNIFSNCSKLKAITIPDRTTKIDEYAFENCSSITSITIPNSITSIKSDAFSGCSNLTSIVWNAKKCTDFRSSNNSPFHSISTQITSFVFGEDVEHIPSFLCYKMSKLTAITIPKSVKSIGEETFCWCNSLTAVNISDIASWCSIDFGSHSANPSANLYLNGELVTDLIIIPEAVKTIKSYAFSYCKSLTSVTIPNSVTCIGYAAFDGCSNLTSITIPNSVTSIKGLAFCGCDSLTTIYNYAEIPQCISSSVFAFTDIVNTCTLYVPANSIELYQRAEVWKDFINIKPISD